MTLIVGIKTSKSIHLFSDTLVSSNDVTKIEEMPGRLKLVAVPGRLCIGYAGLHNTGIDAVRQLTRNC
jgi:hypothetical protein